MTNPSRLVRSILFAVTLTAAPLALAGPRMPVSADDHQALAQQYRDKATALRQEAREHREMAEAYQRQEGKAGQWTGEDAAHVTKMIKSLKSMAAFADQMADEAMKAADYHALRAKELATAKP